jgi:hypothetical protein
LEHASFFLTPFLVEQLQQSADKVQLVLVGQAAWNAYIKVPLETQELCFCSLDCDTAELFGVISHGLTQALKIPTVQHTLALLQNVQALSSNWFTPEQLPEAERAAAVASIHAAERKSLQPEEFINRTLRVIPHSTGWRIQVTPGPCPPDAAGWRCAASAPALWMRTYHAGQALMLLALVCAD